MTNKQAREVVYELTRLLEETTGTISSMVNYAADPSLGEDPLGGFKVLKQLITAREQKVRAVLQVAKRRT